MPSSDSVRYCSCSPASSRLSVNWFVVFLIKQMNCLGVLVHQLDDPLVKVGFGQVIGAFESKVDLLLGDQIAATKLVQRGCPRALGDWTETPSMMTGESLLTTTAPGFISWLTQSGILQPL